MKRLYHVYHYRGVYQISYDTKEAAEEWIKMRAIPSEYYWELGGRG